MLPALSVNKDIEATQATTATTAIWTVHPEGIHFILPWMWGISSRLLQQSTAAAPYLGRFASRDFECGIAPLVHCPCTGREVVPLGHHP